VGFVVTRGGLEWVGPLRYNRFAVTQGGLECGVAPFDTTASRSLREGWSGLAASVFEAVAAEGIERVGVHSDVNHRGLAAGQSRLYRAGHVR